MEKQTLVFRYLNIYVEDQDDAAKFFEELGFYKLIYHTYKNNGIPLMRKYHRGIEICIYNHCAQSYNNFSCAKILSR